VKNKALLFTLVVVFALAGGVYFFSGYYGAKKINVWNIIPQQAVAVFEPGSCSECTEQLTQSNLWHTLQTLLLYRQDKDKRFASVVAQITAQQGWITSLHVTGKNHFDFVFYWPATHSVADWLPADQVQTVTRVYQGVTITEYRWNEYVFSVINLGNLLAASFTPYLVEDVIRTYASDGKHAFAELASPVASLPMVKRDAGNLYLNMPAIAAWLNCFPEQALAIPSAGAIAALDMRATADGLTFNGFTLAGTTPDYLSTFHTSKPVTFSHKAWISERSLVIFHQAAGGSNTLYEALYPRQRAALDSLAALTGANFKDLYAHLGPELSVCLLEHRPTPFTRVLLFDTQKPEAWLSMLNGLSNAAEREDTVYAEQYGSYLLREIKITQIPAKLFGLQQADFHRTFFTWSGNTIFMAPTAGVLKQFLDDIDQERVLGKSLAFNRFLETTLLESNLSIYVNAVQLLGLVAPYLAKPWQDWYRQHRQDCSSWGFSSLQFSHLNNSFYTQLSLTSVAGKPLAEKPTEVIKATVPAGLYPAVYLAENHTTKQQDIVVQDSSNVLRYLTPDGRQQWSMALPHRVTVANRQVDYFANDKLQLVFAVPGQLHVVDRLGNEVAPFPVNIPVQQPEFLEVIDYDNSKRYRFLITDAQGRIWMFDKEGKNLDGWKPLNAGEPLSAAARHYRIRGKDFMVALRQDGQAMVYNRRGELLKGFPLNLGARPLGDVYLDAGTTLANSVFTCISREGIKTGFTVDGKIAFREPLVKTTVTDKFWLVNEPNGKGYITVRQSAVRLSLLSETGDELVVNDFVGNNPVKVKYFNLGAGKVFYTITDVQQQLTYVYDAQGEMLTAAPLPAAAVALSKDAAPRIITLSGKTVVIESR